MTILHGSRLIIWRPDAVIFSVPSEASGMLIRGSRQAVQFAF